MFQTRCYRITLLIRDPHTCAVFKENEEFVFVKKIERTYIIFAIGQVVHLSECLSFPFQTFEYFRETAQLLEQNGSINVRNGKVAILQEKDVNFSANMWRPILTAYWVSNERESLVGEEPPFLITWTKCWHT